MRHRCRITAVLADLLRLSRLRISKKQTEAVPTVKQIRTSTAFAGTNNTITVFCYAPYRHFVSISAVSGRFGLDPTIIVTLAASTSYFSCTEYTRSSS